jgi:hypothetical protein
VKPIDLIKTLAVLSPAIATNADPLAGVTAIFNHDKSEWGAIPSACQRQQIRLCGK